MPPTIVEDGVRSVDVPSQGGSSDGVSESEDDGIPESGDENEVTNVSITQRSFRPFRKGRIRSGVNPK
eukprot:1194559-Prorocentrum_minimum.AAC.4